MPAVRALAGRLDEPPAALTLAFVLGRPVPRHRLAAALPRLGVAGAVRMGLVETAGEGPQDAVRAVVDLRPYAAVDAAGTADWWVASDRRRARHRARRCAPTTCSASAAPR